MKSFFVWFYTALFSITGLSMAPAHSKPADDDITKVVKTVFTNLRAEKGAKAFRLVDLDVVSRNLLQGDYQKSTEAQRKEFASLFQSLYIKINAPRMRETFKDLVSVMYDQPEVKNNEAWIGSLITIYHPLKKQEIKLKYSLLKGKKGWRVTDVAVLGSSVVQSIREDQIKPILEKEGIESLLKAMREKDAEWK